VLVMGESDRRTDGRTDGQTLGKSRKRATRNKELVTNNNIYAQYVKTAGKIERTYTYIVGQKLSQLYGIASTAVDLNASLLTEIISYPPRLSQNQSK